jgi:hypothetical protein
VYQPLPQFCGVHCHSVEMRPIESYEIACSVSGVPEALSVSSSPNYA